MDSAGPRILNRSQYAIAAATVLLSLMIPVAALYGTYRAALANKPFGRPSRESKIYQGSMHDGELWFLSYLVHDNTLNPKFEVAMKRINLETGIEHDTGLRVHNEDCFPLWLNGELYGIGSAAIYRKEGNAFKEVAVRPKPSANVASVPFIWDDRLTFIVEFPDGAFRMVHLVNGTWQPGRAILLPETDSEWWDDPQTGRRILKSHSSEEQSRLHPVRQLIVHVVPQENEPIVFVTDFADFSALRMGFEFVDEDFEAVSALRPENAIGEVSGWQPINPLGPKQQWTNVTPTADGLLFSGREKHLARRKPDGSWTQIQHCDRLNFGFPHLYSNSTDERVDIVCELQHWNLATIYRIQDNAVQPAHLSLRGSIPEYIGRWRTVVLGILLAWALHWMILLTGTQLATRKSNPLLFPAGNQVVPLASIARRAVVFCVDLLIGAAFITTLLVLESPDGRLFENSIPVFRDELDFCNWLFSLETATANLSSWSSVLNSVLKLTHLHRPAIILVVLNLLAGWSVKVLIESLCGITPGKWLMNIRTIRTSLRSVGFARIIVRDVLFSIDIPLLLSPIPAAISIILSPCRQRLGDRIADTVVVGFRCNPLCPGKGH